MTKRKIIETLRPKCNGIDLPLSLNLELIAELICGSDLEIKKDNRIDVEHINNLIYCLKIGIKPTDEDFFLLESHIEELTDEIKPLVSGDELLSAFFNHKSDANKYLMAEDQEDLIKEFREWCLKRG